MSDKHTETGGGTTRPPIVLTPLGGDGAGAADRSAANQTEANLDEGDAALLETRIAELQSEHAALDALIGKLALLQSANEFELRRLKKRKLKVKDSIILLQLQLEPDTRA